MPRQTRVAGASRAHASHHAVDVAALCRDGGRLAGEVALRHLPRLAGSVLHAADVEALVRWQATGLLLPLAGSAPQCAVDLTVTATLTVECQRCLQPLALPLAIERRLRFVHGEDAAARLDEELDDDVLALEPRLDLVALVEDELLLALPLVPRHESCPQLPDALRATAPGDSSSGDGGAAGHPFAALAHLRRPPEH